MASQDVKHRTRDEHEPNVGEMNNSSSSRVKRQKRTSMAKRGLRSLAIAVALPLSLTLLNITLFGSSQSYHALRKPFWFPPLWALHMTCLASSFIMGLSAWLVWAEGGFHKEPMAVALFLSQLALSLAWDPVVFTAGATRVGLVVCLALFGVLAGCSRMFRKVNPIAGDLVKLSLAWAGFLALVNLNLVYL
ncbi:hypothetical protein RJ639_014593 [Escallonia herrerae]|uniref:Translocator protein homolog n=1 Tax=Escallonia herrerae TaxID=1293975 RepID=A0AA88VHA9_9ASTE|nr:hypothetical protein RJ639_014593 [Escallonia herrerae]